MQTAIDATGRKDLAGAVLYTTAEPCFMCGYAIRRLRVGLVVYGTVTPVIGAVSSIHPILTDPALDGWRPAPTVIGGVLLEECQRLKARRDRRAGSRLTRSSKPRASGFPSSMCFCHSFADGYR